MFNRAQLTESKDASSGRIMSVKPAGGWCPPHRYLVAAMSALAGILAVGTRAAFALVMTHVTAHNQSNIQSLIFSQCSVTNSSADIRVEMRGDVMFLLHTTYYVSLAGTMFPASLLSSLVSNKRIAGVSMLLVSVLTLALPTIIPVNTPMIFIIRLFQGACESLKQLSTLTLVATWATELDKARLFGIMACGIYIAPALASMLTATTLCFVSWDSIFYIYGSLGLVWFGVWCWFVHDSPSQHATLSDGEKQDYTQRRNQAQQNTRQTLRSVPWRRILTSGPVWAIFLAAFSRNSVFALLVAEQPQYFYDSYRIKPTDLGVLATVPYLGLGLASILGGVVSDGLMRCGLEKTTVRKLIYSAGYGTEGLCLIGMYFVDDWKTAFIVTCTGVAVGGMAVVAYAPLGNDMAPQYTSVLMGLALTGTFGSVICTLFTSLVAGTSKSLHSWQTIYLAVGVLHLATVVYFDVMADARLQPWASTPTSSSASTGCSHSDKADHPVISFSRLAGSDDLHETSLLLGD